MIPHLGDRVEAYAMAATDDLGCTPLKQVRNGKLCLFWVGTVYGQMVAPEGRDLYCETPAAALDNAIAFVDQCASIVSDRHAIVRAAASRASSSPSQEVQP